MYGTAVHLLWVRQIVNVHVFSKPSAGKPFNGQDRTGSEQSSGKADRTGSGQRARVHGPDRQNDDFPSRNRTVLCNKLSKNGLKSLEKDDQSHDTKPQGQI